MNTRAGGVSANGGCNARWRDQPKIIPFPIARQKWRRRAPPNYRKTPGVVKDFRASDFQQSVVPRAPARNRYASPAREAALGVLRTREIQSQIANRVDPIDQARDELDNLARDRQRGSRALEERQRVPSTTGSSSETSLRRQ